MSEMNVKLTLILGNVEKAFLCLDSANCDSGLLWRRCDASKEDK